MNLTKQDFESIGVIADKDLIFWLNKYLPEFKIDTVYRLSFFLSQAMHETAGFRYLEEIASGDAYDTRTDLGNTLVLDGDGRKYKGRGIFMLTGADNYKAFQKYATIFHNLRFDFVAHPELIKEPQFAVLSACWFWSVKCKLNELSDRIEGENIDSVIADYMKVTKKINGGYNGLNDRLKWFSKVLLMIQNKLKNA